MTPTPSILGTRMLTTIYWARWIQSTNSLPISLQFIGTLSSQPHLGIPSVLFFSPSPVRTVFAFHSSSKHLIIHTHRNLLDWITNYNHLTIDFSASSYFFPLTPSRELYRVKSKSPLTVTSTCHELTKHEPTMKRGLNTAVLILTPDYRPKSPRLYPWYLGRPVYRRTFSIQTTAAQRYYPQLLAFTTPTTDYNHPSTWRYTTYRDEQAFLEQYTSRTRRMLNALVITTRSYVLYEVDGFSVQLNTSRFLYVQTLVHTRNVEEQC